jgi:lipoyl-dependent peroxiredoxin
MTVEIRYEAEGTAWGGRDGRAASSDGVLDFKLVVPRELGGPSGQGTNPEQLFAVGYAACFHSALKAVARQWHADVSESAVSVRVGIGPGDFQGGYGLEAVITGEIPGLPADRARTLLEAAHAQCPYSKATRGSIKVTLKVSEG